MATIYDLKPRFQALLRPVSDALVRAGLSANDVTLGALLLSVAHGAWTAPSASVCLLSCSGRASRPGYGARFISQHCCCYRR